MHNAERLPAKEVLWPLADVLRQRFFQRQDVYAEQAADGRYRCIRQPLRTEQIVAHLEGKITLGTYLLDVEERARFMVFDADSADEWQTLLAIAAQLDITEPVCYREASRRGGHLWLFFRRPVPGAEARRYGNGILSAFEAEGIELYPKQEQLAGGVGSLIRLPFGRHRKSGKRYGFLTADGGPLAPTLREQILLLAAPRTVPNRLLSQYDSHAPSRRRSPAFVRKEVPTGLLSERLKAALSVREFVGQYVELSAQGSGRCPFHDDQVASFAVNDADNYWHCFACEMGGSIIDFWMQYRRCNFKRALKELADMLLTP